MNTIFLDPNTWDLVADRSNNIAVCSDPYSQAQDAASAIKTFQNEVYYDQSLGIPYWQQILGQFPPLALMKAYWTRVALAVPGVIKARCFVSSFQNREVRGQVQITNTNNIPSFLGF